MMEDLREAFSGLDIPSRLALYQPIYPEAVELKNGRHICKNSDKGRKEYRNRRQFVWEVYDRCCWLCRRPVSSNAVTSDHVDPRGMGGGKRDDRPEAIAPCCQGCNARRGSRRIAKGEICPYCSHPVVVGGKVDRECFRCNAKWLRGGHANMP